MSKLLDCAQGVLMAVALCLCVLFYLAAGHYRNKASQATAQLVALQSEVDARNTVAANTLKTLAHERDTLQAQFTTFRNAQETTDAANKQEIDRLSGELVHRPVRVRLVSQVASCGASGGGTTSNQTATAHVGDADIAQAYGLLPAANSERLGRVINEAETINAAYTSCRNTLIQNQALEANP